LASAVEHKLDRQADFVPAHQSLAVPGNLDPVGEAGEGTKIPA
jgi:hypothetical protein